MRVMQSIPLNNPQSYLFLRQSTMLNEFCFQNISYSALDAKGTRKHIVSNVSGQALSKEVFAILGPSGAGKTSLLNVLTLNAFGKKAEISGKCTLNGLPITQALFAKHFCIVPQEDSHRAFLTCRESIRYAADFWLKGSKEEKDEEVEKLLKRLGLDACGDTRVGNQFIQGLSGGQKKRLSIAISLLKKPSVLLLDEPTSGLDAASSSHVMSYIRNLAVSLNIIVVCTIHQPSSAIYNSFEKVLLLSSGRTAFCGYPERSVSYFASLGYITPKNTNPAEFLLDCINAEFTDSQAVNKVLDDWVNVEVSELRNQERSVTLKISDSEPDASSLAKLSFTEQLYFAMRRQCYITIVDPMIYVGRAVMYLFGCTFFAIIYVYSRERKQDQVFNHLWIVTWFMGVPTSLGVIGVFAFNDEFKSIQKEVKNGMYSSWAYLISSLTLQLPMLFILAVFAVGVPGFAICGMWSANFIPIVCVYTVTYFSYECTARALSVVFDNALLGMLSYLNIWFTSFLFAGLVIPEETVIWPFRVFFTILPLKWGIQTVVYLDTIDATYSGAWDCDPSIRNDCIVIPGDLIGWSCGENQGDPYNPLQCYGRTGEQVLHSLGVNFGVVESDNFVGRNFGIILAIGAVFQFCYMFLAARKANKVSSISNVSTTNVLPESDDGRKMYAQVEMDEMRDAKDSKNATDACICLDA
jgi:ABC-type multidrug transport system ATPase subunit